MSNIVTLPASQPGDFGAPLPQRYEAARAAIAECARVDECKSWADKAAALAAYARQAKDDSLAVYARRIQARAMRRAGELLKLVPRADVTTRFGQEGDTPAETPNDGKAGAGPPVNRTQAAEDAGLSERQRKTALRVAAVPAADFDYAVESQDPPSVTALAILGTQTRPPAPDSEVEALPATQEEQLEAIRAVFEFSQFCDRIDPAYVAAAIPLEIARLSAAAVGAIDAWLDRYVASLPR
ncbi:MAG: hypothetical protein M3N97_14855 [Pseudomonadota bacterium]|nr:hypothetical protein [Pseudomonadota bacterium]